MSRTGWAPFRGALDVAIPACKDDAVVHNVARFAAFAFLSVRVLSRVFVQLCLPLGRAAVRETCLRLRVLASGTSAVGAGPGRAPLLQGVVGMQAPNAHLVGVARELFRVLAEVLDLLGATT